MTSIDVNDEMCIKLRSYIWDNAWVVVWLCFKYWDVCFNIDPLASLIMYVT